MDLVLYFIDNKLGGVTSLNYNLMAHAPAGLLQQVILINNQSEQAARTNLIFPVEKESLFNFNFRNNFYYNLKELRKLVPESPGAMVVNYGIEMAMLDHFKVPQTVFQLVHDSYNLGLAVEYGHVVDIFICHNQDMYHRIRAAFPGRQEDIYYLPHGVKIPVNKRVPSGNKILKLIFIGRLTSGKGIFDLPVIAGLLRKQGVEVEWTCIGAGPEELIFKGSWESMDKVAFVSPSSNEEVMDICADHDIFILPTKFEGSPVSLLEAMSVGLVPVVTDLPGGIRETISSDLGFRIPIDDNDGFASAVIKLDKERDLLEKMSDACRRKIESDFDIKNTASAYFKLFAGYRDLYRSKALKKSRVGSRLDHPLMPNILTRMLRSAVKG